jgi:type IV pilus biogenesis protein PilP
VVLETQPEAAEDVLAAVAVETEQADQDLVEEIAAALGADLQDGEASDGAQVAALDARAADVEEPAELAPPVVQDAPQIEVALALQPKLRPARQIAATSARAQIGGVSSSDDVMASLLPLSRPSGLATRAAEIIKERESVTAKVEAKQQPKAATPSAALNIPSNARVARVATLTDAIDLGDLALVGIFGKSSSRYAMLRTSQGKITKVQTGQKVSGWTVSAIAEDGVRIQKRSKTRVLRLPN